MRNPFRKEEKMCSIRTLSRVLCACVFFVSLTGVAFAQGNSNSLGTIYWPANPPVGIGTQLSGPFTPQNALHIHHDPAHSVTIPAILRLSDGATDTSNYFGALALMPDTNSAFYTQWSNLATLYDLVLHEHHGDLILANYNEWGGAIRMSTTPVPTTIPSGTPFNDLERMTIDQYGNVGIDLPPSTGGLCAPMDQIQIGGGVTPYPGNSWITPGLTIYGGNRFENMLRPPGDTGYFPGDWRYISFNHYVDHTDPTSARSHRFQPTSSSEINFAETSGGLLDFTCSPYASSRGLNDFSKATTMELTGNGGLSLWFMDTTANPYHHLFDVYLPGQLPYGVTRNTSGLSYFHTPLCIGIDTPGHPLADFTNFAHVVPDIGDGKTWMLAVKGAAISEEFYVLDSTWADYVFTPGYKLKSLAEVENYIEMNRHLPGIPSASQIAKTGVPIGRTEAALTKNVEELTLYTIQLSKQNEELSKKNDELVEKFQKLESEVQELKNQKGR